VLLEVFGEAVQGLDEDLSVPDLRERPGGVAEAGVLGPKHRLADHGPDQAQDGTNLLEGLARLVDRLVAGAVVAPGQHFQGVFALLADDPPDALAGRLARLQFKGHGLAPVPLPRRRTRLSCHIYFDYFRNLQMECPPEELVAPLRLPLPERSSGRRETRL